MRQMRITLLSFDRGYEIINLTFFRKIYFFTFVSFCFKIFAYEIPC